MTITQEQLEAWKNLAEEASDGPWTSKVEPAHYPECDDADLPVYVRAPDGSEIAYLTERYVDGSHETNGALIAAARTAIPSLVQEVERLREALRAILDDMPIIDCDRLHHAKKDRHGAGPCPVEIRLEKAIAQARDALQT